jgi:uncharacterized protein (TIGR02145 family)
MCRTKELLFFALILFFFSPVSAQRKQSRMIVHGPGDTTYVYFETIRSEDPPYLMDTLWFDGEYRLIRNPKKLDCKGIDRELSRLRERNDNDRIFLKSKSDSIKMLEGERNNFKQRAEELMAPVHHQSKLPYTQIFRQKWMTRNLNENDIKVICPELKEIQKDEEWNSKDAPPGYCYHKYDKSHENGVLLNKAALIKLKDRLAELRIEWRIPNEEDFKTLEKNLKDKLKASTDIVSILKSGSNVSAWQAPGIDLFGMGFLPFSYRRNTSKEWYRDNVSSIYCLDESDEKLKNSIKIMEINTDPADRNIIPVLQLDLTGDDNIFGVYVRLLGTR